MTVYFDIIFLDIFNNKLLWINNKKFQYSKNNKFYIA